MRRADGCSRTLAWAGIGLVVLLSIALLPPLALAQTATTGALKGTITDQSGAAVPAAEIQVTNQGTGEVREVKSGADGSYVVPLLSPGTYRVEVTANGFERAVHPGIAIVVTETTALNVGLSVGATSTTVEVKATPPIVQTNSSALGDVVGQREVTALPLVTRNFTQILDLSAGVVANVTNAAAIGLGSEAEGPTTEGEGLYVNGARASDNNFQMNGVNVNDFNLGGIRGPIPNPDTIQEFRVQTGMYDAEYGRDAGANVDLVTKTGTNDFHGDLFEFWRNDVLNANDFFLNSGGVPRPELKQNQFGGTLGGPVVKNKLLFFGSYQGTRQVNAVQGRQTFLSPPLTNDRSPAGIGAVFAGQRGLFQNLFGGVGPAVAADGSNINPIALKLLQMKLANGQYLFPTPNPQTCDPQSQECLVALTVPATFHENQYMGNFDFLQSSKNTIQGRFFTGLSDESNSFPDTGGGNLPGSPVSITNTFVNSSISDNYAFSPTLFNQLRFGYNRGVEGTHPHAPFTYSGIGVTSSVVANDQPNILIEGSDNIGSSFSEDSVDSTFDLEDNFSWVHGKHNFRFGGGLTRNQHSNLNQRYYGQVGFATWPDFLLGLNGAQNGTGIFSNVLFSVELPGYLQGSGRVWETSGYFQDDFRAMPRLTLNLGLRYEWLPPFTELHGRATNFNPALVNPNPPASGSFAGYVVPANFNYPFPAGVTKSSINGFIPGSHNNTWGPRIGLAYELLPHSDRMVVRAGYGVYYSTVFGNAQFQSVPGLPWVALQVFTPPLNGSATFADPFMEPIPPQSAFPFFEPYTPSSDISTIATAQNIRPALTQEYTLNLQTALTSSLLLQIAYVGSKADHLIYSHSINQAGSASPTNPIRGETTNTLSNVAQRVPYLGFDPSGFDGQGSDARSNYNALEVTLKKNFSRGLQFLISYTYSKTLATGSSTVVGSEFGGGTIGNQNNLYADYGPANFSRPQRLIVSGVYQLPSLMRGPGYARTLLSGWGFTGVATFQEGNPLTFTNMNSTNLFGISSDFAYYDASASGCNGRIGLGGSVNSRLGEYFNTNCFTNPPTISADGGTGFGNIGPGILRGPDQRNVDLALTKMTPLGRGEHYSLEFRAEFFNVFNTTQFANPDTAFSDGPAFGAITGTSVAPRIGQLALKLHF